MRERVGKVRERVEEGVRVGRVWERRGWVRKREWMRVWERVGKVRESESGEDVRERDWKLGGCELGGCEGERVGILWWKKGGGWESKWGWCERGRLRMGRVWERKSGKGVGVRVGRGWERVKSDFLPYVGKNRQILKTFWAWSTFVKIFWFWGCRADLIRLLLLKWAIWPLGLFFFLQFEVAFLVFLFSFDKCEFSFYEFLKFHSIS